MSQYLDWICKSWNAVDKDVIRNSFKICGLTTALDGSEDTTIHCFKDKDMAFGLDLLREARSKQQTEAELRVALEVVDLSDDHEASQDVSDLSIVSRE